MAIPGNVIAQIQKALLSAYPKESVLEQMVRIELDESLDAIAGGESQSERVFALIHWAESHGWLRNLFDAAVRQNPKNPDLMALAADERLQTILSAATTPENAAEQLWEKVQDRYYDSIIDQHSKIRIFGQTKPKPLQNIYTDVYVLDTPTAHNHTSQEEIADYLLESDRSFSFRHGERKPIEELLSQGTKFIILGKPGAGKTTLLRHLALREAQPGCSEHHLGKVPIFVSLKQYANARKPLLDFIVEQFAVCRFPDASPYVEALLESGGALVLFDGLDEVMRGEESQPDQRGQVAEELEQFALRYSDCYVVISSRIAAINYTFHPNFIYLELADFAPDQVKQFVRHWFMDEANPHESAALADQMLDELARPEHEGIRDLVRSPLLLTLLCLNYAKTGRFPAKRAEVYDEALDALLKTWDETRQIGRGTRYKELLLGRKRQMFAHIAYHAFVHNQILFTQADLETRLIAHLEDVPGLPDSIDIDCDAVLQETIAQHGIFAQQAHRLYSFSHLTFQEYYTAKYIVDDKSTDSQAILLEHITDGRWREVTLMTASLLPDATSFLDSFVAALLRLAASNPQLAATLQQIDKIAATLRAGYRRPATRLFICYKLELGGNTGRIVDISSVFRKSIDFSHVGNLDLARALDSNLESAYERYFDNNPYFSLFLQSDSGIATPVEESILGKKLTLDDTTFYRAYLAATRLFYDCIQLANTPDRRAFEDRILEPPP